MEARSHRGENTPKEDEGLGLAGRWVAAHLLEVGDLLCCHNGSRRIESVERVNTDELQVCNLTVRGQHTFTVSEWEILVHNGNSWCGVLENVFGAKQYEKLRKKLYEQYRNEQGSNLERPLSNVVHGHHIVHQTVPKLYHEVKDKTWEELLEHGTPEQLKAWCIGKTHEHLKTTLKMTDADLAIGEAGYKAAQALAKEGKMPPNLTLAIHDGITHSWQTTKAVLDRLLEAKSKDRANRVLKNLGEDFLNGIRVGHQ